MLKDTEIQQSIRQNLAELKRDYAVSEIGFFGSYARREQTSKSDLDILVEFSKPGKREGVKSAFDF